MARGLFDSGGEFVVESKAQQQRHAAGGSVPQGGVETLPRDLLLLIRVTQMLRGLGAAADAACGDGGGARATASLTLAQVWAPDARRALRAAPDAELAETA